MSQAKGLSNASSTWRQENMCAVTCLCLGIDDTWSPGQFVNQPPFPSQPILRQHLTLRSISCSGVGVFSGGHVSSSFLFLLRVAPPRPLRCWVCLYPCNILVNLRHPLHLANGTLVGPPTVPLKLQDWAFPLPFCSFCRSVEKQQGADASSFSCSNIVTDRIWMAVITGSVLLRSC